MKKVDLKFRLVQNNVIILGLWYKFIYTKLEVIVIIKIVCTCSPSSNPSKWKWVTENHSATKGKSAVQKRSNNKKKWKWKWVKSNNNKSESESEWLRFTQQPRVSQLFRREATTKTEEVSGDWRVTAPLDLQLDFLYFCFRLTLLICPFKRHKRKRVRRSKLLLRCFFEIQENCEEKIVKLIFTIWEWEGGKIRSLND